MDGEKVQFPTQIAKSEIWWQFTNLVTRVRNVLGESEQQTQVRSELLQKQIGEATRVP